MLEENKAPGSPPQSKTISINKTKNFKAGNAASTNCNFINPPQSFSLLLETCPAPGALATPLISGLPGSSPLTGRQAAALQLAQLKAQLALTQINNVFAVGGRAPTLAANSSAPAPCLPTKPPSPTAVAINLLNVLKIANTMSHPIYNPFAPGKQIPPQGPYGLSGGQMERDPRRPPPQLGPGSGYSSSGSSSVNREPSGGRIPSLLSLPVNYRPERNNITVDEDIDRCLDLHISRAREEVNQTSSSQNTHFTNVQRDMFPSTNTGMPSYLSSPATQVKRSFAVDNSSSSLDWLPICQRGSDDASKKYPSASSSFLGGSDGLFSTSSEGKHNMTSIPGLGDYDKNASAKSAPPPEAVRPKYTSESASNILLHFGLEKEDLEHLISYPEDQITPENLPFILRQIQLEKGKRASATVQSQPYAASQSSMGEKDRLIASRGPAMNQGQTTSNVLKPSQVIDYGHTGKYTTGVGNEVGRTSGSSAMSGSSGGLLRSDSFKPSSHGRESLQRGQVEPKTGPPVSSHSQMGSVSSFGSLRSSMAPSSSDPSKILEMQTNQTSKSVFSSFGFLNKDTDFRRLKTQVPQAPTLKQPEPTRQAPAQTQPSNPSCNLVRGVHPGRPGLVLIHRNESPNSNQSKIQGQGLKPPQQASKPSTQQQQVPHPQRPPLHTHPQPIQPLKQLQRPTQLKALPAAVPPLLGHFPVRPPAPGQMEAATAPRAPPPAFNRPPRAKMGTSKLPTPAMMQDYAAATPRIFPHTCCLCMKECTDMKDWLSHQNTSLHLESCRLLRGRYPDWDGKPLELLSGPGNATQPSPATLGQNSQNRHQKSIPDTRSHSASPHRQRSSEDRKERRSSRSQSRSPHHRYGSESSRQKRSSRSRSRSPYSHHASEGQRERRSSRSPHTSRHSRRSRSRSYDRPTTSRHRSRSRSYERRSSPRKREARRSSPRRSYERRSHERRCSAERLAPQRKRSRSADRLAKRLLETSAVQSLSQQSDLEAMVKTLAPALLAELAKMKSSSTEKKTSSSKSAKSGTDTSPKPSSDEPLSPEKVKLYSVYSSLSHNDISDSMWKFGNVRNVFMIRSKLQAVVQFEKEEDAEKLKSLRCFQVKGLTVYVDKTMSVASKKPQVTTEQKSASQKKSAESSTKSTPTEKDKTTKLSTAENTTTGKPVGKTKSVSTKPAAVKSVKAETEGLVVQKPQSPEKMADAGDSKDKVKDVEPESTEAVEVTKESKSTVGNEDKAEQTSIEVNDPTPGAETSSKMEEAKTQPQTVPVKGLVSRSAPSENQTVPTEAEGEEAENMTKNTDPEETSGKKRVEERGKTGPTEPKEAVTSHSKDKVSDVLKPAKSLPVAAVPTPPRLSPPKTSTDPRQTARKMKDEGISGKDSSKVQTCTLEELETETEQQLSPKRTETKQKEAVSNVSAVKLEEPTPAEGAATAADVSSPTVTARMEKQEQQEEIKSTPMETVTSSQPLSEDSNNEEQPEPQTYASVSPSPAASAEPLQSGSVKAGSSALKIKSEVDATSAVSLTFDENAEKKQLPKAAEEQTTAASSSSSTTPSVIASSKPEENAAELLQIDENIFKALTTALREHREWKGRKNIGQESVTISKTTFDITKEENTPFIEGENKDEDNYSDPFDEFDFNFGDFVTVDEISEEIDDTPVEDDSSPLEPASSDITEGQSADVPSSKSEKGPVSLSSSSVSTKKQKTSSEAKTSETKTSSVSTIKTSLSTPSKSVETLPSSGQKPQPNKRTPPVRSTEPSSSGRTTRSSTAATKSSVKPQQAHKKDAKPAENAVAKSDHHVSAESCAANTVESELRVKTLEKNQPAEGQISQIQNLETDVEDEKVKEMKKSEATDGKSTEDNKNDQILDSLNQESDQQKNEDKDQDRKTETQNSGPEKDQIIHQGDLQVVDKGEAHSDECHEMEIEESTKIQSGDPKVQMPADDGGDEETKGILSPEGSAVRATSDVNPVASEDTNQTLNNSGAATTVKQEDEIVLLEKVCETSNEVGQICNEEDHNDGKDALKDQKLVVPNDLLSKAGGESTEEEVYQVIDSLEDQPTTTTETESETEKKEQRKRESTTTSGDDRPTRQGRSRSRTCKSEEKEKLQKQQDKTIRKYPTRTKDSKTEEEKKSPEDFEEMVYEVVDSIEDDSVKETSTTESSGRRRPARGHKKEEKTSTRVEKPNKSNKDEERFKVLDSLEEESLSDKPVVTRSARGRRETTAKKVEGNAKTKEDKTPPTRRRTPARDSQEKDGEKTTKIDINVPPKESTLTNRSDARPLSDEESAFEVLDAVEEEVIEPTTQRPRRGRPKKENKTTKRQAGDLKTVDPPRKIVEEEREEATYQILDSVEDEVLDNTAPVDQDDDMTAEMIRSLLNEDEEEPIYQIVDSLEEDQFPEDSMTETSTPKESETTADEAASTDRGTSAVSPVEPAELTGGVESTLLQLADKPSDGKENLSPKGSDIEKSNILKTDGREDEPLYNLNSPHVASEKSILDSPRESDVTASQDVLVNLDQVSEEEEDYPDDAAEEEELKKRQAAAAKRREKDREDKAAREREIRETTETEKASQEKVEVDTQDLVTLDEVGEDEVGEEAAAAPTWDGELTEGELQDLVTLDEIAEEEEEEGKTEATPQSQQEQSVDSLKPETLSALTENAQNEEKKDENEDSKEPSGSTKRKHHDATGESGNFVTDEVGETEEEKKEAVKTRGGPRKRSRQTPVKRSSRGKTVKEEDCGEEEEEEKKSLLPSLLDSSLTLDTSGPSRDVKPGSQRTEEEKSGEAASTEHQPPSEAPDGLKLGFEEAEQQEHSRAIVKEDGGNCVTDEVRKTEEEKKEAVKTRGGPGKKSRQTPVKRFSRGETGKEEDCGQEVEEKEEEEEEEEKKSPLPSLLDSSSTLDTSGPSRDVEPESQRTEEEKSGEAASTEHQPPSEAPDGLKLGFEEAEQQEHSRAIVNAVSKRKQELTGPEAKRPCPHCPSIPVDLQLPPFNPKTPLGKEFVNPTSGFFCSLCSVFYLKESTATEVHCSSQRHYDNLQKHYQRLRQAPQGD